MNKTNAAAGTKPRKRPIRLGTEFDVAELLGVTHEAIRNARSTGRGVLATIPWFKLGSSRCSRVRYDLDYVEDVWLEKYRRSHEQPEP